MDSWTAGYVADIGYTYGYYAELNPTRVSLALLNQGYAPPKIHAACELGFGQGVSLNLHAAASSVVWTGTDFNPAQAAFAQSLANVSGVKAQLFDRSFEQLLTENLPDFDYIGLHGIWSWISDDNRRFVVDLIRRKLKPAGVVYISYNTLPGWSAFAPIRHLWVQHAHQMTGYGQGIVRRIDEALSFTHRLIAAKPAFAAAHPSVAERINQAQAQSRRYLAHEYFNREWRPMYFSEVAEWLEGAKLQFAASAHYLDAVDVLNLSAEQQSFLAEIPNSNFRQTVRDFMVNQQFRRDYWIKGARTISPAAAAQEMRGQRVVLTVPRHEVPLKVAATQGEAALSEQVYVPLLDLMADHQPRTLGQIEAALAAKGVLWAQIAQAAMILIGAGHMAPSQTEAEISDVMDTAQRINVHILNTAMTSDELNYLCSPVTGGGVAIGRPQQLFLQAIQQGVTSPSGWAKFAWQVFSSQGQRLIKEGKPLESGEENVAEISLLAEQFQHTALPVYEALKVV